MYCELVVWISALEWMHNTFSKVSRAAYGPVRAVRSVFISDIAYRCCNNWIAGTGACLRFLCVFTPLTFSIGRCWQIYIYKYIYIYSPLADVNRAATNFTCKTTMSYYYGGSHKHSLQFLQPCDVIQHQREPGLHTIHADSFKESS